MYSQKQKFDQQPVAIAEFSTTALLLSRFDGRVIIPFSEALAALSYHVPTARNQMWNKTFPMRVEKRGKRLYIELAELIRYARGKNKRGRKTKAEKLAELGGAQ